MIVELVLKNEEISKDVEGKGILRGLQGILQGSTRLITLSSPSYPSPLP